MTDSFRKILAPVYFDETSTASLDYAAYFARRSGGTVFLLHVVPTDEVHLLRSIYHPEEGGGANVDWAEKVARRELEAIARGRLAGIPCEIVTYRDANPSAGIFAQEVKLDADLVVLATHARSGLSRLVLRSVAERVVRESSRPVFIAQQKIEVPKERPFRSILCPIDLDRSHRSSLRYASQLARDNDATVHLLHVVPTENLMLRRDIYHQGTGDEENVVRAERVARQTLDAIGREHLDGIPYEVHVHTSADSAKTILEMERELKPDLLIMVTQGLTGLIHLIVGSVTETVIREGSCPVLSVHAAS